MMKTCKENKPKTKKQKIVTVLIDIILIASLLLVGIGVYTRVTGNNVIPYKLIWVLSQSMEDTIPRRSFILIKKVDPSEIKVYDVITFISSDPDISGNYNTHRVIDIIGNNDEFVTKGDNNVAADEYTALSGNLIGKYICNLPTLTAVGRFFATTTGYIVTFVTIVVVFVLTFCLKTKGNSKEEEIERRIKEEVERLEREALEKKQ